MAKRRARRHRRGPSVRGITIKRRNNPGMALSPKVLLGIGVLVIGGAAAYYFLSKSSSSGGGGGGGGQRVDAYGNPVDSQGNVAEQPQLPSEEPTATTPEIVIPANVTPVATPANTPTGTQPRRVTLGPSITQPSTAPLTADARSKMELDARTPANSPNRPRFKPDGTMSIAEYERYEKLPGYPDNAKSVYVRLLTPAQDAEFMKARSATYRARAAAEAATATANYEREAGAALMPIAVYVIYNNSQAEFDKDINRYRADYFYHLLYLLVTGNSNTHPDYKLISRLNGSPEAKAYRLKRAKEMGALWAKSKERATISGRNDRDGKPIQVFKALKEGGWNNSFKG